MREIHVREITDAIATLSIDAARNLPDDVLEALRKAQSVEISPLGQEVLAQVLENAQIARDEDVPLCQDTGVTVVFLMVGQDVHFAGGSVYEAVHEGVRRGYREGYLRLSVVADPIGARINTGDNTPAVIHTEIVSGDKVEIAVMPKGGGSENMARMRVLTPAEGRKGLIDFVVETVDRFGSNSCPPLVVGVGVGGTVDKTAYLAKKSLLRNVGQPSPEPGVAELEAELLDRINRLGIGPMGLGGRVTALAVHIETYPSHIASLPVVVNLQCHGARHKAMVL